MECHVPKGSLGEYLPRNLDFGSWKLNYRVSIMPRLQAQPHLKKEINLLPLALHFLSLNIPTVLQSKRVDFEFFLLISFYLLQEKQEV